MTTPAVVPADLCLQTLRDEMIGLAPWHLEVEVAPGVTTRLASPDSAAPPGEPHDPGVGKPSFINPREGFATQMTRIYPHGLAGRSFLDCACNCGGYVFWAKELGAGNCVGFDVREHWIRQAKYLAARRTELLASAPAGGVRFEVCDLYDLPRLNLPRFDITHFKGIFYHLPDPITGLRIAADLTKELLILNTATRAGMPDGSLAIASESRTEVMSGVHGLNWFPTGPEVLRRILQWMGFRDIRCVWWRKSIPRKPSMGRIELLAARTPGLLDAIMDIAPATSHSPDIHSSKR